jgi:hypothetical protein
LTARRRPERWSRALHHRDHHGGLVREIGVDAVILRAQFHARHIAHAHLMARGIGADHDIGELLGIGQAALRFHAKLESLALGIGRLAQRAGGHLHVLRAQGGNDLARRQVAAARRDRSTRASHSRAAKSCTSPTPSSRARRSRTCVSA